MLINHLKTPTHVFPKGQIPAGPVKKDFARVKSEISRTTDQLKTFNESEADRANGDADVVTLEKQHEKLSKERILNFRVFPERLTGTGSFEQGQLKDLDINKGAGKRVRFLDTDDARIYHEEHKVQHKWTAHYHSTTYREDKSTGTICMVEGFTNAYGQGHLTPQENLSAMADPNFELDKFEKRTRERLADAQTASLKMAMQAALTAGGAAAFQR